MDDIALTAETTYQDGRGSAKRMSLVARSLARALTWERALYLVLVTVAGFMRFWDLGSRAMHHDESLHAFFSLNLIGAYQHNPLMHGPFQFFGINTFFNIFGDSDASARGLAALMGTILVALPYFLRGYLGRWGAITASLFLAFSPTLLYFSRFARNDIIMALWTLVLFIAAWKFLEAGKARYLYLGAAILTLALATKENSYIILFIVGSFLFLLWLRQPFTEGEHYATRDLFSEIWPDRIKGVYRRIARLVMKPIPYLAPSRLIFMLVLGWGLASALWSLDIYETLGRVDFTFSLAALGIAAGLYLAALPWIYHFQRYGRSLKANLIKLPFLHRLWASSGGGSVALISRPGSLWLLILLLVLPVSGALLGFLQGPLALTLVNPSAFTSSGPNPDHRPGFPDGAPVGDTSLAVAIAVFSYLLVITLGIGLKWNWRRFLASAAIFWGIFVFFYTTAFTNLGRGLGSGLWQSMGYWIAQQDVERGAQPWYYYLILAVTYEFLPLLLVLAAVLWILARRGSGQSVTLWLVQGTLAAVVFLLVLSPFWMPASEGLRLAVGLLLLAGPAGLLAWYWRSHRSSFWRRRLFIADVAILLLVLVNWLFPRILAVWDTGFLEAIVDAQAPLNVAVLAGTLALITLYSLGRGDRFAWLLIYWLGMTLVLYSFASEKMPWLMVHTALPLAFLAGLIVQKAVEKWRNRIELMTLLRFAGVVVIGLLAFHTLRISVEAAYGAGREGDGDVPFEMLVYTQTSPDITNTLALIQRLAQDTGKGQEIRIVVDRTSGFEWPWRWYLRDYKNVQWPCYDDNPNDSTCIPMSTPPDADVLILHSKNRSTAEQYLGEFDRGQQIRHRAWFPEFETYKRGVGALPLKDFFEDLVNADSWGQWLDYFLFRDLKPDKPQGSEDSIVFIRRTLLSSSRGLLDSVR